VKIAAAVQPSQARAEALMLLQTRCGGFACSWGLQQRMHDHNFMAMLFHCARTPSIFTIHTKPKVWFREVFAARGDLPLTLAASTSPRIKEKMRASCVREVTPHAGIRLRPKLSPFPHLSCPLCTNADLACCGPMLGRFTCLCTDSTSTMHATLL
jgi:hypothetical protein